MSDFDMENATAVELVREILRIAGVERWEALTYILKPPTDEVERAKADKMIVRHIKNIARVDEYLARLKQIFREAVAREHMRELREQQNIQRQPITTTPISPPKKFNGKRKNKKNKH